MVNVLFICSQNRLRSPTAEQVFADWPGVETASAGINHDAQVPVCPELLEWADLILVMEPRHRSKLSSKFKAHLRDKKIICLNIPDDFELMAPELIDILRKQVPQFLPG